MFSAKIKTSYKLVKCSIVVSFYEFQNGASPFTIYGTKWKGFNAIVLETKKKLSDLNSIIQKSNLNSYINSNSYNLECPTISLVQQNLDALFGLSTSSSSVIQSPSRIVSYSLVPSEASTSSGNYEIEYDSNSFSSDYSTLIKNKILEEYEGIASFIPLLLGSGSLLKYNPLPNAIKTLEQFAGIKDTIEKHKSDIIQGLSNNDSKINAITTISALFFTLHLILIIIATFSIFWFAFREVQCFRMLNNCCWISFTIAVIIGFVISILLIIAAVYIQDVCDFISFESITSEKFKVFFNSLFPSGDQIIEVCFNGDGNFATVLELNIYADIITSFAKVVQILGGAFFGDNPELLHILDAAIGTRIDHCCITQTDSTMKECSGLFPY